VLSVERRYPCSLLWYAVWALCARVFLFLLQLRAGPADRPLCESWGYTLRHGFGEEGGRVIDMLVPWYVVLCSKEYMTKLSKRGRKKNKGT
jgi:hypothetical protein